MKAIDGAQMFSMDELIELAAQEEKVWAKKVYISDGYLTIDVEYPYHIELKRIDAPAKLLAWICHLLEKNWVTRETLFRVVLLWEKHFKTEIRLNA